MARASKLEKMMLNLINAAREKAGARDLRFEGHLNQSAEDHSEWMIRTDKFSHTGAGGSSPTERMTDAGYRLTGSWATGENIAAVPNNHNGSLRDEIQLAHRLLMDSPGHRANILSKNFKDIGIGVELGKFNFDGRIVDAVVITQNFGRTSANQQSAETQTMPRTEVFDPTEANSLPVLRTVDDFLF